MPASRSSTRSSTCSPTAPWPRTSSSAASRARGADRPPRDGGADRELLAELAPDDPISPRELVGNLPVARQQTVEIAKALSLDARIMVMDEPTAALAAHEVERLFEQVRRLKERGLAVLYISHRLKEVFEIAERITVLKDGKLVKTVASVEVSRRELVRLMVGRELDQYFPPRAAPGDPRAGPPAAPRRRRTICSHDIDLDVHAGEILGVAGLQGSGRTELARAIFGADPFDRGTFELDGKSAGSAPRGPRSRPGSASSPRTAKPRGWPSPSRSATTSAWRGAVSARSLRREHELEVGTLVKAVELRFRGLGQEVRFLSGGNQQKVVLAKWLATEPRLVIFDEPTRGIDVGAKAGIHDLIRGLANEGVAVVMISSELPEVIGMSDRIIVMRQGSIAGELAAGPQESEIMFLAHRRAGRRERVAARAGEERAREHAWSARRLAAPAGRERQGGLSGLWRALRRLAAAPRGRSSSSWSSSSSPA